MRSAIAVCLILLVAGCRGEPVAAPVAAPIGRGPEFLPPPSGPFGDGRFACTRGPLRGRFRAHVELFARRLVVVVPAGIGVGPPRRVSFGRVQSGACRAPLRTLDPSGVVDFDRAGLNVGDLFAVWRMTLSPRRLLSFRGAVTAFVDGRRARGDVASIPIRDGAEIVLEIGGHVPPHRSYLFPPR